MAKKQGLGAELRRLLSLRVTDEELALLKEKGLEVKNPTKLTLLAAALLEKGAKGDLSAIKEILLRTGEESREFGGVTFIDDIRNKD
jgi:hypothetical protein